MYIRYKNSKNSMYNNSNGAVEHGNSTTNASKEDNAQTESKREVIKMDKALDADGKEAGCEIEHEEEEETLDQPEGDAVETEENITETLEKDAVEGEHLEQVEEADEADADAVEATDVATGAAAAKGKHPDQEELSGDDKKITIEILKEEHDDKKTLANVSSEDKSTIVLDMCRVCMGTEDLSDIFQLEGPIRVSDIIMKVCTNIRITARDHLPHKICERCLGQVRVVNEFKTRCEASDKELRKNLKRSTNKSRRQSDFIVVNCPMSDSEKEDDEPVDDDEYKVSQSEVESEPATSDDSFSPPNKRKYTPKRRIGRPPGSGRRGRPGRKPKNMVVTSTPAFAVKRGPGRPPKYPKSSSLTNIVYIEAPEDSSSSGGEEEVTPKRRKRGDNPCPKCDEVLPSQLALKQHLKTHPGDKFDCDRCVLFFRTERALLNHIERHKKADKIREEKRKEREQRIEQRSRPTPKSSDAEKSKFSSPQSSGTAEKKKKSEPSGGSSGRDLFKCVAPLTSTYWSDSFSD